MATSFDLPWTVYAAGAAALLLLPSAVLWVVLRALAGARRP